MKVGWYNQPIDIARLSHHFEPQFERATTSKNIHGNIDTRERSTDYASYFEQKKTSKRLVESESTKHHNSTDTTSSFAGKLETLIVDDEITVFKENYSLKPDTSLTLLTISNDNSFKTQEKQFSLDDIEPISIFKQDATYLHNGVSKAIPPVNVYTKEDENEFMVVTKSKDGRIKRINTTNKKDGKNTEIAPIIPSVYALINDFDIDYDVLNEKYRYDSHEGDKKANVLNFLSRFGTVLRPKGRKLQENENVCNDFFVIELAVAYESSFCEKVGGGTEEDANNEVYSIIAAANQKFKQPGLCMKVVLSHLEGYCDANVDPYKQSVDLGLSGCDCEEGLVDAFGKYWMENRKDVIRDSVQLFSGTSFKAGVIGCSKVGGICVPKNMYGVNHVSFTESTNLRAVLIAHELGHNMNADHTDNGFIMAPSINSAQNGFSPSSMSAIVEELNSRRCKDVCTSEFCCLVDSDCDNGLFCDGIEVCNGYNCTLSDMLPCDDDNICTEDICNEFNQTCTNIPIPGCCLVDADCDNGLFCDGQEICSNNICTNAVVDPCNDADVCTVDSCDEIEDICIFTLTPECIFPSSEPSLAELPSTQPSSSPSAFESDEPSSSPSALDSEEPSLAPSVLDSEEPSLAPSVLDSEEPSLLPSAIPTTHPTLTPSTLPTAACVVDDDCDNGIFCDGIEKCVDDVCEYSDTIMCDDGDECTYDICRAYFEECVYIAIPNCYPTSSPSQLPSIQPSLHPSAIPSFTSSVFPTLSTIPSIIPSMKASDVPSSAPTELSSFEPSSVPFSQPSSTPSNIPFSQPSSTPSNIPSLIPAILSSSGPSVYPTSMPSSTPSSIPSLLPSAHSTSLSTTKPS